MGPTRNLAAPALCLWASALALLCGCAGGAGGRGENQSETRFEKERALAALRESLATERAATAELRRANEEREAAHEELARLQAATRYLSEQVR